MTRQGRPGRRANHGGGEDSRLPLRHCTRLIRCHPQNVPPPGRAAGVAAGRGAEVAGLDASEALIAIARARTPGADTLPVLSPPGHVDATLSQGDTGRPGVAERMLADAGLEFVGRGAAEVVNEWPDLDLAVRALASGGPSWPALQSAGDERFAEAIREAIRPLCADGVGVRTARNRLDHRTGPGA